MTLTDVLQTLCTLFMLVTLPIYILFLITLYKNRHEETLKFPFFKLMFSIGIADMGTITTLMLGNTLADLGWVPELYMKMGELSSRLHNAGIFGFGLVQDFGMLAIAFNRFTAYMRPIKHSQIWTDKFAMKVITIQWLLSLILITPILFYFEFEIEVLADNRTVLLQWQDPKMSFFYNIFITGLICGAISAVILIVYSIIFISALLRKIRSHQPMSKVEKTALKMAIIGFIGSVGLLIILIDTYIYIGTFFLFGIDFVTPATFWLIFNMGSSIYAAINPYALLLFSSAVRHRFVELICCSWHWNSESTGTNSHQIISGQPAAVISRTT